MGLRKDPWPLPQSDSVPAARTLRAIQLGGRRGVADSPSIPGHKAGKAARSKPPQSGTTGPIKTDLKHTADPRLFHGRRKRTLTGFGQELTRSQECGSSQRQNDFCQPTGDQ